MISPCVIIHSLALKQQLQGMDFKLLSLVLLVRIKVYVLNPVSSPTVEKIAPKLIALHVVATHLVIFLKSVLKLDAQDSAARLSPALQPQHVPTLEDASTHA